MTAAGIGLIFFVISWLFYDCIWVTFLAVLFFYPALLLAEGRKEKKRRKRLTLEFKDYMYAVSSALLAGYSIENAFIESQRDIRELYGEKSVLLKELGSLRRRLGCRKI